MERWRKEYLTNLREFHRAKRTRQNNEVIQIGDVVTVFEEGKRRNKWKLAVVEELVKGRDNVVRGAKVRAIVKGKIVRLSRPIQKLFPIEVRDEEEVRQRSATVVSTQHAARSLPKRKAALDARLKTRIMLDS